MQLARAVDTHNATHEAHLQKRATCNCVCSSSSCAAPTPSPAPFDCSTCSYDAALAGPLTRHTDQHLGPRARPSGVRAVPTIVWTRSCPALRTAFATLGASRNPSAARLHRWQHRHHLRRHHRPLCLARRRPHRHPSTARIPRGASGARAPLCATCPSASARAPQQRRHQTAAWRAMHSSTLSRAAMTCRVLWARGSSGAAAVKAAKVAGACAHGRF